MSSSSAPAGAGGSPAVTGPTVAGSTPAAAGRAVRRAVALLAVLVVALAVACAVLLARSRSAEAAEADRAELLAAAKQEAVNLTSQDHRTVATDLRRTADGATGPLRADLDQRRAQTEQVVRKNKVVARGSALDAGIVARQGDSATVIVAVDSTVTSTASATPTSRRYRFQLDLSRVGGRWLVSNLTALGLTG
jgi:Mce-associated membrane protein